MTPTTQAWVRYSFFVFPVLCVLLWLAFRGDLPWKVPQSVILLWLGLGAGTTVTLFRP